MSTEIKEEYFQAKIDSLSEYIPTDNPDNIKKIATEMITTYKNHEGKITCTSMFKKFTKNA